MKLLYLAVILNLTILSSMANSESFNSGWRFNLGDTPQAKEMSFNDSQWRELRLPHDWALEGGYAQNNAQKHSGGYMMGGVGWYRKTFTLSAESLTSKHIFIDFEGVYMNSEVWINGTYLGKRPYGYISFSYELTPHLKDGENTISVRVDNSREPSARWRHGCGIYGNVTLRIKEDIYFERGGVFVQTPTLQSLLASVEITSHTTTQATLKYHISDPKGRRVASGEVKGIELNAATREKITINATLKSAELWSPQSPNLYTLVTEIKSKSGLKDTHTTRFGIRSVEWCAQRGLIFNGEQTKIKGVCEHLDGGATGSILSEPLLRWKLQQLKDMGCNAIRVSHNPTLPIFYDLCDEMGFLVMDEIFDGWHRKAAFDYGMQAFGEWWERDVREWIRSNRNHPSIFIYSVGNETHGDIAPALVKYCHDEDPTRLVTSGDCNPDDMDVYGVNGRSEKQSFFENWDKRKPFVATENPHTWQVRGFYRTQTWYRNGYPNSKQQPQYVPDLTEEEIFKYDWTSPEGKRNAKQLFNSSYDNAFVRITSRHILEIMRDSAWFSGAFRWTGYDYLGEAEYVHGGWPFRSFQSGAMDLAGFKKDLYYLYQSEWSQGDMVHILPHWTHPTMEHGTLIPVWVYTSGDEVELLLNGRSLGRKSKGRRWNEIQCEWMVAWEEGTLEAIAYRQGKEIARTTQQSAGAPSSLSLTKYEHRELLCDEEDIAIVTIEQQDDRGLLYPYGENRTYVKIYGGAKMLSFESGSPVDVECNYEASSRRCFMGLNRMFIQSSSSQNEPVSILVAAICADKRLTLSGKVSICVEEISLRGALPKRNLSIRYTTNGRTPSAKSELYTSPFDIEMGTIVKAIIFDDNEPVMSLEEHITRKDGLYWAK